MKVIEYPQRADWKEILKRPSFDVTTLFDTVRAVLDTVRKEGDKALKAYELQFDKVELGSLEVTASEMIAAEGQLSVELCEAIRLAYSNISKFHKAQVFTPITVETQPGVTCCQRAVPIEKVGLYIPGGTAPLFSTVLMLATPAKIAGCKEIILCTPPNREGKVNPAILFAAQTAGVSRVFKVGGSQAIAAMAYGTESVPQVDKIFGPGNQYVTAAKQLVSLSDVAIDMPAGPSEVEVLADEFSNPTFVAADLLSQAEHGADSQVLLVSTSRTLLHKVQAEVEVQLARLPRRALAEKALANSRLVLVKDLDEAIDLTNAYAPEHLVLANETYREVAERITHAGSVFLGKYSCESAGDYASGTNHTLPTKGYAKAYSGLCLDSFVRKITFQEITSQGVRSIGRTVELMASGEQLEAHRNAMTVRLESLG
ncbi:MAG: histidinol dehydrogenase [Bacteroidaceae bacterium]